MGNKKQTIGKWGEEVAAVFLEQKGYQIIDRNFYSSSGEIDLIALIEEGGEKNLVFIEVKTRTGDQFGYPEEAVTQTKLEHMQTTIEDFLLKHPAHDLDWQVDVVSVLRFDDSSPPEITHFENILMPDGRDE